MKKLTFMTAVVLSLCFMISSAFAGPYYVASNVRVVQAGSPDPAGRVYPTIQGAINSIADASSTKPYVVKVMPGIYSEVVTMKPYVNIVGSGQDSTIISSSASTGNAFTSEDHTSVENITITTTVQSSVNLVVIKSNTSSVFRNVTMKLPQNSSYENILLCDTGSNVKLFNSTISSEGTVEHIGEVVGSYGTSLELINSTIAVIANNDNVTDAINASNDSSISIVSSQISLTTSMGVEGISAGLSPVKILNSTVQTHSLNDSGGDGSFNLAVRANALDIQNSVIIATSGNGAATRGVDTEGNRAVTIKNSVISGTAYGIYTWGSGVPFKIGNSQIVGGHNGTSGVDKVVNCFDENYNPIPNL